MHDDFAIDNRPCQDEESEEACKLKHVARALDAHCAKDFSAYGDFAIDRGELPSCTVLGPLLRTVCGERLGHRYRVRCNKQVKPWPDGKWPSMIVDARELGGEENELLKQLCRLMRFPSPSIFSRRGIVWRMAVHTRDNRTAREFMGRLIQQLRDDTEPLTDDEIEVNNFTISHTTTQPSWLVGSHPPCTEDNIAFMGRWSKMIYLQVGGYLMSLPDHPHCKVTSIGRRLWSLDAEIRTEALCQLEALCLNGIEKSEMQSEDLAALLPTLEQMLLGNIYVGENGRERAWSRDQHSPQILRCVHAIIDSFPNHIDTCVADRILYRVSRATQLLSDAQRLAAQDKLTHLRSHHPTEFWSCSFGGRSN